MRHFLSLLVILTFGCKVTQTPTTTIQALPEDSVTDISIPDTTIIHYLITLKGDTLQSLDEEVDLPLYRVLPDTINIAAVGDIMIGTDFPNSSYLPPNNGQHLWNSCRDVLKNADIAFGNLEGTMLDGEGEPKECKNPDVCYLFRMPSRLSANLTECGFDLMSTANNHANDFGRTGRRSTQKILDSIGIVAAGSVEQPYTLSKHNGVKVGFVAFAPNTGTLTFYDTARAVSIIKKLDSLVDFIVVSIHGGAEGAKNMHVTREREFYYGEDRGNIYEFSHKLIEHGADLILGHGPHVPRAIEVYNKKLIAYSLGNFCTYGRFNLRGSNAEAPLLVCKVNSDGDFLNGNIVPFRQSYSDGPMYDHSFKVVQTIKRLSEEDFPENEIIIDDAGRIIYIQN
ncbi:CapA family protein [Marinoscillum sp. MHG1-6]|uniref:CapA family protein n=1 Tax=Marinoscillum sp. MHG1-6 TaxID=2959627 RepID=UPI002157B67D|nr:CapA family protein [Marinoscillum sp. MHG1-6]